MKRPATTFTRRGFAPLSQWDGPGRIWGLGFLLCAAAGLAVALFYVHVASGFKPEDLATRFHGPETEALSAHSWRSLLQTTHTHLFTLAFLQFMLGGLTLLSSLPKAAKAWLAGGVFPLLLLDHAAMWALHLRGGTWSVVLLATGTLLTLALAAEILACAKDLLKR